MPDEPTPLSVTLLGFDLEFDATWIIPGPTYPPILRRPINHRPTAADATADPVSNSMPVAEYEPCGPIPGTYRRVR